MSSLASVTAVIPTYNSAALLPRCIESVLAQTLPVRAILVVDDGSTDDTAAVAARYPNVRYIRQENRGTAAARNTGILAAETEWIALLDGDDRWHPQKIERQIEAAKAQPEAALIYSDATVLLPDGTVLGEFLSDKGPASGWVFDRLLQSMFVLPSTAMIRRETLVASGMFAEDVRGAEDYDLWLRIAPHVQFLCVPEALTLYERQPTSISRNIALMSRNEIHVLDKVLRSPLTQEQRTHVHRRKAARLFGLAYEVRRSNPREAVRAAWNCLCMEPLRLRNWRLLATNVPFWLLAPGPEAEGAGGNT